VDVIIDEAHESFNPHPFKGNICSKKLKTLIEQNIQKFGNPRIPYIAMAGPVNMAGG
jgi:tryptophanase